MDFYIGSNRSICGRVNAFFVKADVNSFNASPTVSLLVKNFCCESPRTTITGTARFKTSTLPRPLVFSSIRSACPTAMPASLKTARGSESSVVTVLSVPSNFKMVTGASAKPRCVCPLNKITKHYGYQNGSSETVTVFRHNITSLIRGILSQPFFIMSSHLP